MQKKKENDEKINIHKSESRTRSIKRSDVFEEPLAKESHKRHCDWTKSSSDTLCPNIKFAKNHVYQKALDRLRNYVTDGPNILDSSQKCETLSR